MEYSLVQRDGWQIRAVEQNTLHEHELARRTGGFAIQNSRKRRYAVERALFAFKSIERALEKQARRGNITQTKTTENQPMRL
jgi:hypothetical protein